MAPVSPPPSAMGRRPPMRTVAALLLALSGAALVADAAWIHIKARVAQVLLERAFDRSIAAGMPVKPWSWADTWPVARISVPRLEASVIVLAGSSGQALAFGPAQVEGTPEAGSPGTTVYAAHRDTHFAFLRHMRPGDAIDVTTSAGGVHRFEVTRTRIARWDASGIDADAAGRRLVLATCWPFESRTPGPMRFLVHARIVGPPEKGE